MEYLLAIGSFSLVKSLLWLVYLVLVVVTIGVIISDKREPVKALAWITVIALIPFVGIILYIVLGRNHRKQKLFIRKEMKDTRQMTTLCREQIKELTDSRLMDEVLVQNRDMITLLLNNNKAPLTTCNTAQILVNGNDTFESIFEAIEQAKSSIHLEYYIVESDEIGSRIAEALIAKAQSGVEVRLIYDDVGSWGLSPKYVERLRLAGVKVCCFMPVVFPWFTSKVNYRNHRKILVVDGRVAFTGGINIADRYLKGNKHGIWRDTHLRVEGEAAKMLQAIFVTDWNFLSPKENLGIKRYFPKSEAVGYLPMQIASSGPDSDWASIMQAFFAAITRAKDHIYISTPYFLPNQAILVALKVASLKGLKVKILIPSRSDSKVVYWATRSYVGELLDAGIKIYMYRKGFNHSKLIMIDGDFCSIGSANMDIRSFEDNFEVTALIYDRPTTAILERQFEVDMADSREITVKYWKNRSLKHNIYESFSRLLSPLL